MSLESRTARLTILIDPRKKAVFERLCAEEDATPSQVVRRLLRTYIEQRSGHPWRPVGHHEKKEVNPLEAKAHDLTR
ncbi:CopG family transcriptional regulator [Rhodanobacter sp. Root627]|uniref:CopG family transcriptional regulator n=1 Tax=Rhodanobacter sp. Root627 TaxID=1736572 RepID=UPI001F45988A|nr:CopG family transcriptional regulator [Rhodanobacter sp. Root627]